MGESKFKQKAIDDGWTVQQVDKWYEARDRMGRAIVRKGYEDARRFKTPRGAWCSIIGVYASRAKKAQRNAYRPGEIPYLGD